MALALHDFLLAWTVSLGVLDAERHLSSAIL
jgi:hypothetical protein